MTRLAKLMEQAKRRGLDVVAARDWALDYRRQGNAPGDEYDIEVPELVEFEALYEGRGHA